MKQKNLYEKQQRKKAKSTLSFQRDMVYFLILLI